MAEEEKPRLTGEEVRQWAQDLFNNPVLWENFRFSLDEAILTFCAETDNTSLAEVLEDDSNRAALVGFLAEKLYRDGYM